MKKILFLTVLLTGTYLITSYISKEPSHDKNWSIDQKVLPHAVFNDNEVGIFNIRNFSYQTTDIYTPSYYDRTYNLDAITSVDYIVEPLGDLGVAHTLLSFGFENGDYVAISAEIRKEVGESFSPLQGMLREYELMYVIADERDIIKLRTNYRKDTVYLYPIKIDKEHSRELFVDMLTRANNIKETPEFYNTLTNTCTTNIVDHVNKIATKKINPLDIRVLLPAHSDALAYDAGLLDTKLTLTEAREIYKINDLAEQFADSPDFSAKIRSSR